MCIVIIMVDVVIVVIDIVLLIIHVAIDDTEVYTYIYITDPLWLAND